MKLSSVRAFVFVVISSLIVGVLPVCAFALDDSALQAAEVSDALVAGQADGDSTDSPQTQADGVIATGTWGTCPWEIDSDGVLTVHPGVGAPTSGDGPDNSQTIWWADYYHLCPWADYSQDITRVVFVVGEDGSKATLGEGSSLTCMFIRLNNVTSMDLSGLDTAGVTDMSYMFVGCGKLEGLDLSMFDTSSVRDMTGMFLACDNIRSLDLSSFTIDDETEITHMLLNQYELASIKLGSGVKAIDLRITNGYGTDDWYSENEQLWFTPEEIASQRLGIADTYTKRLDHFLPTATITLEKSTFTYTSEPIVPSLTVKIGGKVLREGVDYEVVIDGAVEVGTRGATVYGKGDYYGGQRVEFTIVPAKLASLTLSQSSYTYDGKQKTPEVVVKSAEGYVMKKGVDYDLIMPEGRTNAGSYTYTAKGKGNCEGTVVAVMKVVGISPVDGRGKSKAVRLSGQTALDTMSAIVDAGSYPKGGTVVLATSGGYWDALTAAGIAGLAGAPVLMTDGSSLSQQTRAQITKLKPKTIVICGGTAAVAKRVENDAKFAAGGATAVRCAGQTATGTACEIFKNGKQFGSWSDAAFVCTNAGYWDALAAAPVSYARHMPIFLTEGASYISKETLNTMKAGGIKRVYIVGGEAAISPKVLRQIQDAGIPIAGRLWGNTAIETSEEVAGFGVDVMKMTANNLGIATSGGYWDALAGAALCGRMGSVLVLVDGPSAHSIWEFVWSRSESIANVYVFGGTAAISKATGDAAVRAAKYDHSSSSNKGPGTEYYIKGNISYSTGEKIYHLPGDRYYDNTEIDESAGERWFSSESEAQAAGWRRTKI